MKLELHILQNFAPSNLNRDDTGAPKDCEFGGVRRARISSQCFKRAIRQAFSLHHLVPADEMGARTKRLAQQVADRLVSTHGLDQATSMDNAKIALSGAGLKVVEDDKTQYLLYLPRRHIEGLAKLIHENWDVLGQLSAASGADGGEGGDQAKAKKNKKDEKAAAKATVPKELAKGVADLLSDASKTPDVALFGRMIADNPDWNVDAACQVAHAMSTNRVGMEFDFYTAVDDFRGEATQGSDMMGTIAFNSACFYRYLVLDCDQLGRNLNPESEAPKILRPTVEAFLKAAVLAVPTGKQNSMAAQNPPSYILTVVRPSGAPVSLANAFLKPVKPTSDSDLVDVSIERLDDYFRRVSAMYPAKGLRAISCADRSREEQQQAGSSVEILRRPSLDALIAATIEILPS
jgi:CRISPR system Cascade subunit CasC